MKCPQCTATDLAIAERQGIEIDYCPRCRGVWLDRGELDRLIERAERMPEEAGRRDGLRERHDGRHDERDGGRYRKRRKSFLGDLFDFD